MKQIAVAMALLVAVVATRPAPAEQPATTLQTLLDKQQIQDMLVDYYAHLGRGENDFGHYYLADGVIDVNGLKGQGEAAIKDVYKKIAAGTPKRPGVFKMLLTNVSIVVNGNSATAETLWTGVNSPTISGLPQFAEQGTERDDLVKMNGHWLFKLRVITSNAGRQAMFDHMPIKP
ncbi:MAG TPA: nuclear transport factor 2 family protein [Steroidobacteraceae bacterium]|nr:nuclear transport factor 2 family protein [Steroidobacteraceae bacterium]